MVFSLGSPDLIQAGHCLVHGTDGGLFDSADSEAAAAFPPPPEPNLVEVLLGSFFDCSRSPDPLCLSSFLFLLP